MTEIIGKYCGKLLPCYVTLISINELISICERDKMSQFIFFYKFTCNVLYKKPSQLLYL